MHKFNYRFLSESIASDISGASNVLFDLRARNVLRLESAPAAFDRLRHAAIVESVRGSSAIEGIVTTRARLKGIVEGTEAPQTHGEREILGYRMALQEIYERDFSGGLTEDYVRHLHSLLLGDTSVEAGSYKSTNNLIQERDGAGRISVRFVPVSARETPDAMEQLVLAYHEARGIASINELALVACVVIDFLCIHPFTDGNGRVSRLLTTMLLQSCGFDIGRYVSIEGMIDYHKAGYYDALKASSEGWHENCNDYQPFILYLMRILYACYKELDLRYAKDSVRRVPKAQQVEAVLMDAYVPISKAQLCDRLPNVSVATINRVLRKLMADGKVEKIGSYRDARYRRA